MAFSGSGEDQPQADDPIASGSTSATSAAPGASAVTGDGSAEADWTDQVTELVVDTVDKVRSRTTGPVLNIAHGAVYGIVAAIIILPILVAFFAGLVKGLNWLIPGGVWIVYCIIAAMLWLGGWAAWLQRDRADPDDS